MDHAAWGAPNAHAAGLGVSGGWSGAAGWVGSTMGTRWLGSFRQAADSPRIAAARVAWLWPLAGRSSLGVWLAFHANV